MIVVASIDAVEAADEAARLRDEVADRVAVFVLDPAAPDDLAGAHELADELARGLR